MYLTHLPGTRVDGRNRVRSCCRCPREGLRAGCAGFTIYVHDELFTADTLHGQAEPMPQSIIEAIRERLGDVTFVNQTEADALFGDDALVDGGSGVLILIGPVEELAEGVVGVEVGLVTRWRARAGAPVPVER